MGESRLQMSLFEELKNKTNLKYLLVKRNMEIYLNLNEVVTKQINVAKLVEKYNYSYSHVTDLIYFFACKGFLKIDRTPRKKFINFEYTDKGMELFELLKELREL